MGRQSHFWAATSVAALFLSSGAYGRVPVVAQMRDDDCGAAATVTILRMAGVNVSEKVLLGYRPRPSPRQRGAGLSALDLKRMVAAAALGVELQGTWELGSGLVEAVRRAPVLVLVYERGKSTEKGTPGFGHFIVLESWSESRGFLVADPALGKRGFLSLQQVDDTLHGRMRNGRRELLLMRPTRNGRWVASSTPVTSLEEQRLRTLDELRRLGSGLPAGKMRVTLAFEAESYAAGIDGPEPSDVKMTGETAALTVEYGLDRRTGLVWSAGVGRGEAFLSSPALGRFDLGSSVASTPMQLAVTRRVGLGRAENVAADISVGASFAKFTKPIAVQAGITTQFQLGRTALIGGFDLALIRQRKQLDLRLAPSIGANREVVRGWIFGGNLSAVASASGLEDASLGLSLQTAIRKNWYASAYVTQSIYSIDGSRTRRIGLSLTHDLPNYLR